MEQRDAGMSGKQKQSRMDKLNRRARRRRRLRAIQLTILFAALAVAAIVLVRVFVVAKTVCVENNTPYSTVELLERIGYDCGSSLYSLNPKKALDRLSDYPYVANVSVRCAFPTTARIVFERESAVFCVQTPSGCLCLNRDLRVLNQAPQPPEGSIPVLGLEVDAYDVGQTLTFEGSEAELLRAVYDGAVAGGLEARVTEIDLTKKYDVTFTVDGVFVIELGTTEDIAEKIKTAELIMQRNDPTVRARINVRDYRRGRYLELADA